MFSLRLRRRTIGRLGAARGGKRPDHYVKDEVKLIKHKPHSELCPISPPPSQSVSSPHGNTLTFNELVSFRETNRNGHCPREDKEVPIAGDLNGAKLPYMLVHDLRIEQAVAPGIKPVDE